jgi:hypothetical protein
MGKTSCRNQRAQVEFFPETSLNKGTHDERKES